MRVLLLNANRFKQPWPVIPFGLCCVASAVEEAGHEVRVVDLCFSRSPARDIERTLGSFGPDVVGVSVRNIDNSAGYNTLFLLDDTKAEVIDPLKRLFAGPIVIGGPAVGINAAEMLNFFGLPYAIRGDGEHAMVAFLERLEQGGELQGMPGLVRREDARIVEDNEPYRVADLDGLPTVRPHRYLDLAPYRQFGSPLQVQTKRGCALQCTYCTYNQIEGRHYRLRAPQKVADEIEALVKETGFDHVEFTDSTFNIPLGHAKNVLRAVIEKGLKLRLRTMGLNPAAVDEELVDLMKEAGFSDVDLGVEAASARALKSLGKHYGVETIIRAARLLRSREIPVTWYLLLGSPAETRETLEETFATVKREASPWDLINVGVGLRVYKGAPVSKNGTYGSAERGFLQPVHVEPEGISLEEIKTLTKLEALRTPNLFMYDEDENTPPWVLKAVTFLLRAVAPRQPVWRLFILKRKVERLIGVARVRRWAFERSIARALGERPRPQRLGRSAGLEPER